MSDGVPVLRVDTRRFISLGSPRPYAAVASTCVTLKQHVFVVFILQEMGMDWSIREGYAWVEDKEHCEEYGRMLQADPTKARQNEAISGMQRERDRVACIMLARVCALMSHPML